ncbi:MAG: hypothetical protein MK160_15490 [Rhodobacteraceae bacterium]|nr:hypothetical protein [Paracoccaceae bacterium]
MADGLPTYFFRIRENGAQVFRVDTANRQRRIEMDPIAVINIKNGEVKPQGDRLLSETDMKEIRHWMQHRENVLAARELDDIQRTLEHLNMTAQWAQSRATEAQLDEVTDALLLAMHDLRTVLVRKRSETLAKE